MANAIPKVIIIDDNFSDGPLLLKITEEFGKPEIFEDANEGLKYVLDNIVQKMIVMLDLDLGQNFPDGQKVFDEIRKQSHLVLVIIITAVKELKPDKYTDFINQHAFAFLSKTDDYTAIVAKLKDASTHLNTQVDSAIEEWILTSSIEDRDKPYITSKDGKQYSLNQILVEVRKQTEFGKQVERDFLQLTMDLLARGKKKI